MLPDLLFRPYRSEDEERTLALWHRPVYREEDQIEKGAMFERARRAQEAGDRWLPIPPRVPGNELDRFEAFWVAEMRAATASGNIVGMVGVYPVSEEQTLPTAVPLVAEWLRMDDVAVLEHLRVADEVQRRGIGTRLIRIVEAWCRDHGYRTLILNTTSAQIPALHLYRKVGFREVLRSFVGKYELVWFEMDLTH